MIAPFRSARRAFRAGAAALLAAVSLPVAGQPSPPPTPVKLAVIVAVDGLSWERLAGYRPWFTDGLKRLLDESQVHSGCNYAHLNTETGPGHASLGTGAPPRVHGIVANRWFEKSGTGLRTVYCTDQTDPFRLPGEPPLFYREVERDGRLYVFARQRTLETWEISGDLGNDVRTEIAEGRSIVFESADAVHLYNQRHGLPPSEPAPGRTIPGPAGLRIATLGDRLVEQRPGARVVALSGKDRGAIFLAGKDRRHVVYWYSRDTGRFETSAAYDSAGLVGGTARDLVRRFNEQLAGGRLVNRFGTIWSPLPAPVDAAGLPQPARDIAAYQAPTWGLGFDHDLARDRAGYFAALYATPFQDQLLADLTLAVLADPGLALGRRGVPDLLALSFSAHDVVSHNYGNESAETLDALRRLDRELGRLLAALDELAAAELRGQVVLALSSDHGFSPLPEVVRGQSGRRTGGRLPSPDRDPQAFFPNVQERLSRALAQALCLPSRTPLLYGVEGWIVAYDRSALPAETVAEPGCTAGQTVTGADLDRVFPGVALGLYGEELEAVLLNSQRERWPADLAAADFARNDFDAERSGDAFLVPREHVLMGPDPVRGSGHGSHHEYDTHVPLLFWGGPFRAVVRGEPVAPYDLAPTLASLLGVRLDERATGTSLAPAGR
jgi:hypothetical protein